MDIGETTLTDPRRIEARMLPKGIITFSHSGERTVTMSAIMIYLHNGVEQFEQVQERSMLRSDNI